MSSTISRRSKNRRQDSHAITKANDTGATTCYQDMKRQFKGGLYGKKKSDEQLRTPDKLRFMKKVIIFAHVMQLGFNTNIVCYNSKFKMSGSNGIPDIFLEFLFD